MSVSNSISNNYIGIIICRYQILYQTTILEYVSIYMRCFFPLRTYLATHNTTTSFPHIYITTLSVLDVRYSTCITTFTFISLQCSSIYIYIDIYICVLKMCHINRGIYLYAYYYTKCDYIVILYIIFI